MSAEKSLSAAVEASIAGNKLLTPADAAVVELARGYARTMDRIMGDPGALPEDLLRASRMGPHLLKALEAMGCTPAARGALPGGTGRAPAPVEAALAQFQARARGIGGPRGAVEEDGEEQEREPVAAAAAGPERPGRARRRAH